MKTTKFEVAFIHGNVNQFGRYGVRMTTCTALHAGR